MYTYVCMYVHIEVAYIHMYMYVPFALNGNILINRLAGIINAIHIPKHS